MKIIYDAIHKYMNFDDLQLSIIDTYEFQRLREIKQLGLCYYIFPGASHNRFEHSLGVSYLCGLLIESLRDNQPELNISNRLIQLVKIAGLVHDLGHACFSHFFDNHFLKNSNNVKEDFKVHERRSCILFEHIIEKYNINMTKNEIDIVKKMIDPGEEDNSFEYQIVANKINGLDCDKFDYIARDTFNVGLSYSFDFSRLLREARVINGQICYPIKCNFEIGDLYYTRYKLHKQIYTHSVVRSIEYMILDILEILDEKCNIREYVNNLESFLFLTDNIINILQFHNFSEKAKDILDRIKKRQLYQLIIDIPLENFNQQIFDQKYKENKNMILDSVKLNYSMGGTNPLYYVKFFSNGQLIESNLNTFIFPEKFEEETIRIYLKNEIEEYEIINIRENLIKK